MPQTRVQILQAMPIFGAIDESAINWLLEGAVLRAVSRGECIFREGDMDSSIYVIEDGNFTVYRHWGGRDYRLRELGTGDCFGEMALMDCTPRSATHAWGRGGSAARTPPARGLPQEFGDVGSDTTRC